MAMQSNSDYLTDFIVSYDGESQALSEHMLDAGNLGIALVSLHVLFDRANFLVNGQATDVELNVQATPPGSFEIYLQLLQVAHVASPFLSGDMVTTVKDLVNIILGVDGLISLIKRLRGERPKSIERDATTGEVTIEIEDLHTENADVGRIFIHTTNEIERLSSDKEIIDAVSGLVSPLRRNGIDRLSFSQDGEDLETVTEDEVEYFRLHDDDTEVDELIIPQQRLLVISPYLYFPRRKWMLNDSFTTNWYTISDSQFLKDLQNGIVQFGIESYLVCDVKVTTYRRNGRLRKDFEILRVLDHYSRGHQPPLTGF